MDRQAAFLELARGIGKAADGADWKALEEAELKMGNELRRLARLGPLKENERKALLVLRSVHDKAALLCSEQKADVTQRMHDIRTNKEGWIAYALHGGINPDGN
jgi:hypothetical protein